MYKPKKPSVILVALAGLLVFSISSALLSNAVGAGAKSVSPTGLLPLVAETPPVTISAPPPQPVDSPPGYTTYSNQGYLLTSWMMSPLWTSPAVPQAGQPVDVWANIYISDIPMSFIQAELLVNGELVASRQLTFWFDDPLDFSLAYTPAKPGIYDVVVRANMIENEDYVKSTGEDLSLYSTLKLTVA